MASEFQTRVNAAGEPSILRSNLINRYKDCVCIIQKLLQNADDASDMAEAYHGVFLLGEARRRFFGSARSKSASFISGGAMLRIQSVRCRVRQTSRSVTGEAFFPDVVYLGGTDAKRLPGFVSIALPGNSAEGVMHILDMRGIAVSTGAACDSKNTQVSHVLKAIRVPKAIAESTIRITFGPENTQRDVDAILGALRIILRRRAR